MTLIWKKKILDLAGIALVLVKFGVLETNASRARWKYRYLTDERKLKAIWGSSSKLTKPPAIPISNISELKFPIETKFNQFNPTIAEQDDSFIICWRISDLVGNPETDKNGNYERTNYTDGNYNGLGIGRIEKDSIFTDRKILNPRMLIEPLDTLKKSSHVLLHQIDQPLDFEDPRFSPENPNFLILHARYKKFTENRHPRKWQVAIMDIIRDELILIDGPHLGKNEKNWIPIGLTGDEIEFLCSTDPHLTAKFNVITKQLVKEFENYTPSRIHNGSNLAQIDTNLYIRVVRERYNVENRRAIHLSSIICHDKTMKEIYRTKPFVFQEYAYEICNSIIEYEGHVFFLWGHNDEKALIGQIRKEFLVEWIFQN